MPEQRNRSTSQNSEFRPQATSFPFPAHQGQFGRYVHQAPGNSHPALPLDTRLPMEIDPNVFELSAMAETHRQVADMQTSGQGHTTQPPANVGPNSQGMGNSAQQATGNGSHFPQQVSEGTFEPGVSELAANAETDEGNQQETITCGQLELNTEHSRPSRLSPGEPQQSMEPSLGDEAGYRKYSMEQLAHEQPDEGQLTNEQPAYGQHTTGQPPDELFGGPLDWTLPDQSLTDWLDPGQNFTSEDVDRMFAPAAAMSQSGDASFGAGVSDCIEVATAPAGPSHAPASNGGHVGVNDRSP
ncbi:hypothetical protein LMH87_006071 [Akanthomyces muscarius]|uniref:Uncharacterized protein n=1 Tax=Akanthomyces muscarius TaxID=2231603 RepID=A0A9W8USH1_AKAMU|nr:hypothetical protein LMH87_006071 [Akanthomyces muscarius]KAJ4164395.1 hypothetical protein LMH87_006071 [Akanthomyces muscarius]